MRKQSNSESAGLKREIQALVRAIVMRRDKGCILRSKRHCGAVLEATGHVFQADHLVTRANSATYADTRLIVCLCRNCHGWKHWHKEEYDALVRQILERSRVLLWDRAEHESWKPKRTTTVDWRIEIAALKQELAKIR